MTTGQRLSPRALMTTGAADGDALLYDAATDQYGPGPGGGTETLPATIIDAKGDLIVGTADNTAIRKAVGSNGQVLTADSTQATGVKWATPTSAAVKELFFKAAGILTARTGTTKAHNDSGATWTILSVRILLDVASSSGTVTVDVNKNGTTIFTTQANRPTLAAAATVGSKVTNMDVTTVADGDYLTFDVDGAGTAAKGLLVLVVVQ